MLRSMPVRIATVGDVHGNSAALEAVLPGVDRAGADWTF